MSLAGDLPRGAYEALVTSRLRDLLVASGGTPHLTALDKAEAAGRLADHVRGVLEAILATVPAKERPATQAALANDLLAWLAQRAVDAATGEDVAVPPQVLRYLSDRLLPGEQPPPAPDVPLVDHDLLTNAPGEPSLAHALQTELETADRLDGVIAFIRWTGLRYLCPVLARLRERDRPVRILTTTFTGSTERRALDWLVEHGVQVKVSYETRTTRLHAKSWLVLRDSGYSTAYVGSSNLSHAALVDGIEWNVRLAEKAAPTVFAKLRATFDSLWGDASFEAYDPTRDGERFERAVQATRAGAPIARISGLEVRPWHYQRQILEALVVERARHARQRNLVVAPTGTGKTVVAALDYQALREGDGGVAVGRDATLLFVAHREQILDQSLQTFRDVLRRGDFGEKFVAGEVPREWRHVFASIQSLHRLDSGKLEPDRFDVVYVDEFHHAEAATYRTLLDHLKPKVLVGLTATPERGDGVDVRDRYFAGRYAFEMRLWDALDQQLLAPFHYFGVADGTDLSRLQWQRGGYRESDLESLYVIRDGNDARTAKVLAALRERVADVSRMRAFGFCVSVAHARYMAERFTEASIPAVSMDGGTPPDERRRLLAQLRDRAVNVVFAVDVLTEGVDVPEVDTIMLLRPTESATVFLQQVGRGLRLHRHKDVCTVLDFIGQQHRRFRFDLRLRAITGRTRGELLKDTQAGFPLLPAGCHIQLDRQAEANILANLKTVTSASMNVMGKELAALEARDGRVTLSRFLAETLYEPYDVYRGKASWTALRRHAGVACEAPGPREAELAKGLRLRLVGIDDPERIDMMRTLGRGAQIPGDERAQRLAAMVGFILFDDGDAPDSVAGVRQALAREPATRRELLELAEVLDEQAAVLTRPFGGWADVPLHLHATYSRSEVLVALGVRRLGQKTALREGVKYVKDRNTDLLFVTLDKSGRGYSPTTRYRDYAISHELFHWESQSGTTRRSPAGRRYLEGSSRVLLFVRNQPKDGRGRAPGFVFLGGVTRVGDRGERPIAIEWKLDVPMPEAVLRVARAVAV